MTGIRVNTSSETLNIVVLCFVPVLSSVRPSHQLLKDLCFARSTPRSKSVGGIVINKQTVDGVSEENCRKLSGRVKKKKRGEKTVQCVK